MVFPDESTFVEHHGVEYPPAVVQELYSTPLALNGNTQATPVFAPPIVKQGPAAVVSPAPVVALLVSGKQFVPSLLGQSPQDPSTIFPLESTSVAHHGVMNPPAVVHSLYVTPLALKGNTHVAPALAPEDVVQAPAASSSPPRPATTSKRVDEDMENSLSKPDF